MLTIFEGPDGGGKTEFARWYTEQTRYSTFTGEPARVYDHGPYLGETEIAHHYWEPIVAARAAHRVLMDRSWIAEPIYGAAFRGGVDRIGVAYRRMLERGAWAARAVVALFLPPFDCCAATFSRRRNEEYLDSHRALRDVYDGYTGIVTGDVSLDLPYVVVDYTRHRREQIAELIAAVRPPVDVVGFGAGRCDPGRAVLVVGDRPGPFDARHGDRGAPFVSFRREGCSAWLAEQLEAADIPESALYFVNAFDRDGRPASPFFLNSLRPSLVVALGTSAAAWVAHVARVPHVIVPHPQAWKRFHFHDEEPYPLVVEIGRHLEALRKEKL